MEHTLFIFLLIIFFGSNLFARSFRVSQIPNGAKFNCGNCHVSSNSGGTRNAFGLAVSNFLDVQNSSGNVQWGSELAILDSDSDDVTNGAEYVKLKIFNVLGKEVATLVSDN